MKNDIQFLIDAREKDIGVTVKRILPWMKKRMVGPFIFLDEMGPVKLHAPGEGMDVRPHPHIGLSTLTYLFEGIIRHKDSLGVEQLIVPGEVNWMTAGKGISHSEREPQEERLHERRIHGLQFWVALPVEFEDVAPSFHHYGLEEIPEEKNEAHEINIIAGEKDGKKSPLKAYSPLTFQVIRAKKEGRYAYENPSFELGLYVVKGSVTLNGETYPANKMIVLAPGSGIELTHSADALFAVIGGVPFPEPRYIWWNFVSSSQEKIELAKAAWKDGSFPQVPGDYEKIPLPEKSN